MTTALRLCAAASIGVWLAASAIAADDSKTPDAARPDPRLDQRITISTAYDSLQELCAKLTHTTEGRVQEPAARAPLGATSSSSVAQDKPEVADQETPAAPLVGQPSAKPTADKSRLSEPGEANGRPQGTAATPDANPAPAEGGRAPSTASPRDQEIARPISVEITCDPAIKEHKVVVRVKEQPLREVMRQVAVLFDFTWMQGPQEHPRYHLVQSGARARRGEELRRRLAAEKEARVRQVFHDILAALVAAPDELTDLAKTDADAVALAVTQPEEYRLLLALDERAIDDVLSGREVVVPFAELPPEVQERINSRFSGRSEDGSSRPPQPAGGYVRYRRDDEFWYGSIDVELLIPSADADRPERRNLGLLRSRPEWRMLQSQQQHLNEFGVTSDRVKTLRERLDLLGQMLGTDLLQRATREAAAEAIPSWARPAVEVEARPDKRLLPLGRQGAALRLGRTSAALPLLLLDVAETLDISLIADCYWTQRRRQWLDDSFDWRRAPIYPSLRDQEQQLCIDGNPEYVLKRICEGHLRGWVSDGRFFRLRNLLWFLDDPEEVPASAIRSWVRRTHDEEHIALEDYVDLLNRLSHRHWENLGWTDYVNPESPEKQLQALHNVSDSDYDPLKLFTLLTQQQRSLAQTTGIAVGDFPERLQPLMMALLGQKCLNPDRTDAPAIPVPIPEVRLFASYRARDTQDAGIEDMEAGGPYPRAFYIELWAGGVPDWQLVDRKWDHLGMDDKGRIEWWSYELKDRAAKAAKE